MALKVDIDFKGIQVSAAHITVDSPSISSDKEFLRFIASYRGSEGDLIFDQRTFEGPYDLDGSNPFEQAYDYLKNLPEFADATDC